MVLVGRLFARAAVDARSPIRVGTDSMAAPGPLEYAAAQADWVYF
ncbi:hypothetical protein V7968_16795 [Nocardia vulneris]